MKIKKNAVMAKRMMFMIPNANDAFNMAHSLLVLKLNPLFPLMPLELTVREAFPSLEKLEQLALVMKRR